MTLFLRAIFLLSLTGAAHASNKLVTDFAQLIGADKNSKKAFEEAISSTKPLVIKFYIIGCGPCKATDPGYAKMAELFKGKADFITLDAIKYEEIAQRFNIKKLPSWVIIAQGKKIASIKGSEKMADVKKFLAAYLAKHQFVTDSGNESENMA
jgi:thioredoxin-like negative regulator of GroEL